MANSHMGDVLEFRRPARCRPSDPGSRAVTLALSHAGFIDALDLIRTLTLSAPLATARRTKVGMELLEILISSISAGDGPALEDALDDMSARWQREIEDEELRRAGEGVA